MTHATPPRPALLARLNPFRGLDNPREVWAWGMFDLANQSFTLIINTLLFPLFFKEVVAGGHESGDFVWSLMVSLSLAIVVVASPVIGALADCRASKKKWLITTGAFCAVATCGLALAPSSASVGIVWAVALAIALYVPANVAFAGGENFLGSFLPEIATRRTMGRISATGWAMGYAGALALLIITASGVALFNLDTPAKYRPLLVFAGIWFAVMMVPTALYLPEAARAVPIPKGSSALRIAASRVAKSVREVRSFRDLGVLLGAFLIYGMGVQVIIFFASVIAQDDLGFDTTRIVLFAGVMTVMAGLSAVGTGIFQDRFGHKRTILAYLALWALTAGGLAYVTFRTAGGHNGAVTQGGMWAVGVAIGLGLGGVGTATRAAVGAFTPTCRTAEFFGLWGMTYKLAGVVGLPIFGAVRSWIGSVPSLLTLTGFFVVGGAIVLLVDQARGEARAEEDEARDAAARSEREEVQTGGQVDPIGQPRAPKP